MKLNFDGDISIDVAFCVVKLPFGDICNCVLQSANPPFNGIELDHSDSGREACTVTTLTITAEPNHWEGAVKVGVQEVSSTHVLESPMLCF